LEDAEIKVIVLNNNQTPRRRHNPSRILRNTPYLICRLLSFVVRNHSFILRFIYQK
jgi:hypothetical protein